MPDTFATRHSSVSFAPLIATRSARRAEEPETIVEVAHVSQGRRHKSVFNQSAIRTSPYTFRRGSGLLASHCHMRLAHRLPLATTLIRVRISMFVQSPAT